ncbi:LysR family transcriptional regulator, partial [Vibrio anguillarum]|nr:LysR family transcriptional regulator [Vibrio anguillarum]
HSCLSLIRSGAGIGIIPDFYLTEMEHNLVNLMPEHTLPLNTVYTLTPFASHVPSIVKLCIHNLEQCLAIKLSK